MSDRDLIVEAAVASKATWFVLAGDDGFTTSYGSVTGDDLVLTYSRLGRITSLEHWIPVTEDGRCANPHSIHRKKREYALKVLKGEL